MTGEDMKTRGLPHSTNLHISAEPLNTHVKADLCGWVCVVSDIRHNYYDIWAPHL